MSKLLVVVDMQNDFIDGALGTKEAQSIVPNVVKKIEEYEKNGDKVIFTRDTHSDNYANTEEGKNLPVEHCIIGTKGWELNPKIENLYEKIDDETYNVYDKPSFGSYELAIDLMEYYQDYDEIELIGICTGVCLLSQAVICKTGQPNAHIVVDASCCACVTPHSHDVAIEAMKTLQIEIRNEGKEPWREQEQYSVASYSKIKSYLKIF